MRGFGELEAIRSALPSWAIEAAAIVTHAGDYAVVVAVAIVAWLALEHDGGPWPVVVVLGAIGLATVVKASFGLPRPPGAGIGGYGFPSGHALGSTVVYGLIAYRLGTRRAMIGAAAIVAIVGFSRVAIGVHYPADIAVGIVFGAAYLAVALAAIGQLYRPETTVSSTRVATDGGTDQ